MISFYRYYEAKRMYKHYETLVKELGDDVPPMIEAQCEITKLEMEHFRDESKQLAVNLATSILFGICIYSGYYLYIVGGP